MGGFAGQVSPALCPLAHPLDGSASFRFYFVTYGCCFTVKGIKIGGSSRFRSNSASGRLEMGGEVTPGPSAYDSHPSVSTPGGVITRARRNINFNSMSPLCNTVLRCLVPLLW